MQPRPPVAFAAVLSAIGRWGVWRVSRLVVLPDYQGIGIGLAMLSAVAEQYPRLRITTGHPAMLRALSADCGLAVTAVRRAGYTRQPLAVDHAGFRGGPIGGSAAGRCVATFEIKANRKISTEKIGDRNMRAGNHLSPLATAAARMASPPLMEKPADMTAAAIACMQLPAAAPDHCGYNAHEKRQCRNEEE